MMSSRLPDHSRTDNADVDASDVRHYLSIDVEDVVVAAAEHHRRPLPQGYEGNVRNDLRLTLDVLNDTQSRATFFVNGCYCDQNRDLMTEIVSSGHTLASHGFRHHDVRTLSIDRFRDDLRRSIDALARYQTDIVGYRPPSFTMPFDDEHLSILIDSGIKYLSCGAAFDRTNVPHCDHPIRLECGLIYVPISIQYFWGKLIRYPIGYGHVSRLMPEAVSMFLLQRRLRKPQFFQFYFHPYELNGLTRHQKKQLIRLKWSDLPQRIYSQRCSNRRGLFARILSTFRFKPLETLEGLSIV